MQGMCLIVIIYVLYVYLKHRAGLGYRGLSCSADDSTNTMYMYSLVCVISLNSYENRVWEVWSGMQDGREYWGDEERWECGSWVSRSDFARLASKGIERVERVLQGGRTGGL